MPGWVYGSCGEGGFELVEEGAGLNGEGGEEAGTGGEVDGFDALKEPAGRDKLGVDLLAGLDFGSGRHARRRASRGCE